MHLSVPSLSVTDRHTMSLSDLNFWLVNRSRPSPLATALFVRPQPTLLPHYPGTTSPGSLHPQSKAQILLTLLSSFTAPVVFGEEDEISSPGQSAGKEARKRRERNEKDGDGGEGEYPEMVRHGRGCWDRQ